MLMQYGYYYEMNKIECKKCNPSCLTCYGDIKQVAYNVIQILILSISMENALVNEDTI